MNSLFLNAIYFGLLVYIIKMTKTIYRCHFLGIFFNLDFMIAIFSSFIKMYLIKKFMLIILLCIIGISITFFIIDKRENENIISDKKIFDITKSS